MSQLEMTLSLGQNFAKTVINTIIQDHVYRVIAQPNYPLWHGSITGENYLPKNHVIY